VPFWARDLCVYWLVALPSARSGKRRPLQSAQEAAASGLLSDSDFALNAADMGGPHGLP
jgi:hypothetical protein